MDVNYDGEINYREFLQVRRTCTWYALVICLQGYKVCHHLTLPLSPPQHYDMIVINGFFSLSIAEHSALPGAQLYTPSK